MSQERARTLAGGERALAQADWGGWDRQALPGLQAGSIPLLSLMSADSR